jgi:hypothetical protein
VQIDPAVRAMRRGLVGGGDVRATLPRARVAAGQIYNFDGTDFYLTLKSAEGMFRNGAAMISSDYHQGILT